MTNSPLYDYNPPLPLATVHVDIGRPVRLFGSESRAEQVMHVLHALRRAVPLLYPDTSSSTSSSSGE